MTRQVKHVRHSKYGKPFRAGSRLKRMTRKQFLYGDFDKDRVPNMFDCRPFDPRKQDEDKPYKTNAEGYILGYTDEGAPAVIPDLTVIPISDIVDGYNKASEISSRPEAFSWGVQPMSVENIREFNEKYFFIKRGEEIAILFGVFRGNGRLKNFVALKEFTNEEKKYITSLILDVSRSDRLEMVSDKDAVIAFFRDAGFKKSRSTANIPPGFSRMLYERAVERGETQSFRKEEEI